MLLKHHVALSHLKDTAKLMLYTARLMLYTAKGVKVVDCWMSAPQLANSKLLLSCSLATTTCFP